jgi:hypothetical protein
MLRIMNYGSNDTGISELIGFVMLLGVITAALALYAVYVVPIDGREGEITHMNAVEGFFTDYKTMLDGIWDAKLVNANSPGPDVTISPAIFTSTVSLGTADTAQVGGLSLSLFRPVTSSGTLHINATGDSFDIDSSSSHSVKSTLADFPISVNTLEYHSNNNYWIQQRYSYQLGGVFLSQSEGTINRVSPLVSVTAADNKSLVVNVVPVRITATNASYTGTGPVRVDTLLRVLPPYNVSQTAYRNNQWVNLSYTTADGATAAAWQNVFRTLVTREQLDSSAYRIGSAYDSVSKKTTVFLYLSGSNPDPQLNKVSLYVQRAEFNVTFYSVGTVIA